MRQTEKKQDRLSHESALWISIFILWGIHNLIYLQTREAPLLQDVSSQLIQQFLAFVRAVNPKCYKHTYFVAVTSCLCFDVIVCLSSFFFFRLFSSKLDNYVRTSNKLIKKMHNKIIVT